MNFLLTGHWLPAIGVALVFVVGLLRMGLPTLWSGFGTKIGGYAIAYVCAFGLYLGTAFQSGTPISGQLLLSALGAALGASGVLDHWRDILNLSKHLKSPVVTSAVSILFVFGVLASCSDCAGTKPTGGSVITSVVDCTAPGGDLMGRIETEALKMAALAFGPDLNKWSEIETLAVNDGLTIGGCAFAKVVNDWITKKSLASANSAAEINDAKSVFEKYRVSYAGGATFRSAAGDM
jgi:hypothetical protein